ncbi:hypothetical protein ElyMa_002564300 [Elysia marginata]|uniref:Uncharacterized protein n=1 Tax=Elysia marginata TaxID=1093978 RepID=A0AAV4H175_9GAST|nr:hypothetical protein ElyMa_002564300 [Elysia marginata]
MQLKNFQKDSTLLLDDNKFYYEVEDADLKIIKSVAFEEETQGKTSLYLAQYNGTIYEPLSTEALSQAQTYIEQIKVPGTWIEIRSIPADTILPKRKIHYSSDVNTATLRHLLEARINAYINSIADDHLFSNFDLDSALKTVKGVVEVERINTQAGAHDSSLEDIAEFYKPLSGYLKLSTAFNFETDIILTPYA